MGVRRKEVGFERWKERGERTKGRRRFVASFSNCSNLESIPFSSYKRRGAKISWWFRPHAFRRMVKNNQASRSSSPNSIYVYRVRVVWPFGKLPARVAIDRAAILQRKGQFTAIDRFNRTRLSTRAVTIRRTLESGVVDISSGSDQR